MDLLEALEGVKKDKIEHCPFCGHEAHFSSHYCEQEEDEVYYFQCFTCEATGEQSIYEDDYERLLRHWNTRHPLFKTKVLPKCLIENDNEEGWST